jgi:hypothetical protein
MVIHKVFTLTSGSRLEMPKVSQDDPGPHDMPAGVHKGEFILIVASGEAHALVSGFSPPLPQ